MLSPGESKTWMFFIHIRITTVSRGKDSSEYKFEYSHQSNSIDVIDVLRLFRVKTPKAAQHQMPESIGHG